MSSVNNKQPNEYSKEERKQLLILARKTLTNYFDTGNKLRVENKDIPEKFRQERGCFVTLTKGKNHDLRGCIGYIYPKSSLYQSIIENTLHAALHDTRFTPVIKDELPEIQIEISVLTIPKKLEFSSPDDLLEKIRPGIDGVYLFYRNRSATYLPQVWEKLPDKKGFFSNLCMKCGAPPNCWQTNDVEIFTYQAEYFSEHH